MGPRQHVTDQRSLSGIGLGAVRAGLGRRLLGASPSKSVRPTPSGRLQVDAPSDADAVAPSLGCASRAAVGLATITVAARVHLIPATGTSEDAVSLGRIGLQGLPELTRAESFRLGIRSRHTSMQTRNQGTSFTSKREPDFPPRSAGNKTQTREPGRSRISPPNSRGNHTPPTRN